MLLKSGMICSLVVFKNVCTNPSNKIDIEIKDVIQNDPLKFLVNYVIEAMKIRCNA